MYLCIFLEDPVQIGNRFPFSFLGLFIIMFTWFFSYYEYYYSNSRQNIVYTISSLFPLVLEYLRIFWNRWNYYINITPLNPFYVPFSYVIFSLKRIIWLGYCRILVPKARAFLPFNIAGDSTYHFFKLGFSHKYNSN